MKYEKPVLRVFLADEARGDNCYSGSTAAPACSYGGYVDATCYGGSSADPCSSGSAPWYCLTGDSAQESCRDGMGFLGYTCGDGGSAGGGSCHIGTSAAPCAAGSFPVQYCSYGPGATQGCGYGWAA